MTETRTTKKPQTREFVATRRFGYSGGQAEVGDIVELQQKEAKALHKHNAVTPHFGDDEDEGAE